jgi:predicted MFS family arabinose efflux permease
MEVCLSACFPLCFSLISDGFHPKFRARASAVYTLGLYLGVAMSSLSIIIVGKLGWRNTYRLIAGLSLGSCLQVLTIQEPKRGRFDDRDQKHTMKANKSNLWRSLKVLLTNKTFLVLILASSLRFLGGYSIGFWGAKFFQGMYEDKDTQYSLFNMIIYGVIGMSSSYTGGYVSDKLDKRFPMTKGIICGTCVLVSFPFILIAFTLSHNFYLSISMFGISFYCSEMWYGPSVSMLLTLFPAQYSGIAIAIFSLTGSLMGSLSNLVLGILGDHYNTAEHP